MVYKQGFETVGVTKGEVKKFYRFTKRYPKEETYTTSLFGNKLISFNNYYWFYHSVQELFLEEVYKCNFKNTQPYIVDCGANIGLSLIYFKQKYPQAKVLAFEPDEKQFGCLLKNIESFGLKNIEAVNKGVWKENTHLHFYPDGYLGGTVTPRNSTTDSLVSYPFSRLKDYMDAHIDLLKIDIEGAEYEVMEDIKDRLENVENLFLEYHGYGSKPQRLHQILLWISEAGFRYHIKSAWENQKYPFIEKKDWGWDMQLNIFCYRSVTQLENELPGID